MDTFEAKNLLEESVRCVARMMEQIRLRECEKVMGLDEPMQDHLAQCSQTFAPYEGSDFEECMEYLQRLRDGLVKAYEHEHQSSIIADKNNGDYDMVHICDMVMGMIGHGFPDYLVECAKEINTVVKKNFPSGNYIQSDKGCAKLLEKIIPKAADIIKKHHLQMWRDGDYSLPLGYLQSWIARRYWR